MRNRIFACTLLWTGVAHAQFGRGTPEWATSGGDAHRSSSLPSDIKINKDSVPKGFALFWKMKLNNEPRQLNALTPPTLMDRHIGIHGFRSFGFVSGSGDNIYAVDTDLARIDWQKNFGGKAPADASLTCPGGMTTGTAHSIGTAFPAPMQAGRGGGGRGGTAKSGVGEAGEGAVTIEEIQRARPPRRRGVPCRTRRGLRLAVVAAPGLPVVVRSLSSDGMFHANFVSNGDEPDPPIRFLPPNANAQGLVIVDNVGLRGHRRTAAAACPTASGRSISPPRRSPVGNPRAARWPGTAGPSFGGDGTLFVSTTAGDLVSLEPKTLKVKDVYRAGQELTSTPVVFQYKEKTLACGHHEGWTPPPGGHRRDVGCRRQERALLQRGRLQPRRAFHLAGRRRHIAGYSPRPPARCPRTRGSRHPMALSRTVRSSPGRSWSRMARSHWNPAGCRATWCLR